MWAEEALALDDRRERFRGAESTHVNGLDLALGEQLLQKASDPKPLRRFGDGQERLIGGPG